MLKVDYGGGGLPVDYVIKILDLITALFEDMCTLK